MISVSQVIPVIPVSQVIPVIPVSQVSPVSPASPESLAHLWFFFGVIFTGAALNVLIMELVPPNKEIDWFRHKSSKYGTGPTQ